MKTTVNEFDGLGQLFSLVTITSHSFYSLSLFFFITLNKIHNSILYITTGYDDQVFEFSGIIFL